MTKKQPKFKRFLSFLLMCSAAFLLSGCDYALLNPKGVISIEEKRLLLDSVYLMLIVVIPVMILSVAFAWHYRASNTKAKYSPDWSHSYLLEFIWWAIPIAIILVLGAMTWTSSHSLDPYKPLESDVKPITIEVVSLDWKWLFIYPEQNIATVNFVEFPVNTPINFKITSDAPMNAFMITQLAGQIYSMQGMQTKLHLMANTVGNYDGRSVNYSGRGFADMKFIARAATQQEFDTWVSTVRGSNDPLSMDVYKQLAKQSEDNPVHYYSSAADHLFSNIMMKYMMPMMDDVDDSMQTEVKL